jgi:hypothetical protein
MIDEICFKNPIGIPRDKCSHCYTEKLEQENKELRLSAHRDGALEDILKHNVELINKLSQENKMMRECLDMICLDNFYIGQDGWKDEYFLVVKNAKECLNKLIKDER